MTTKTESPQSLALPEFTPSTPRINGVLPAVVTLLCGDSLDVLADYPENHFSAVVTDPPYGLSACPDMGVLLDHWLQGKPMPAGAGFMGEAWDAMVPGPDLWKAVFRVLKPGGLVLAFAGSRTQDLMGLSLRLAGFEIRDSLAWIYGTGNPKASLAHVLKSSDSAHEWEGWDAGLKPSHEPILMARKPLEGTLRDNLETHRVGALHVDACRLPLGRWPTNVALAPLAAADLDDTVGNRPGMSGGGIHKAGAKSRVGFGSGDAKAEHLRSDCGGPSRFFYCPKASKAERLEGLSESNSHPTVKPLALMRWLVRLSTPPGGLVLDPFGGSGTTGVACCLEGFDGVVIERQPEYAAIARARIAHVSEPDLG